VDQNTPYTSILYDLPCINTHGGHSLALLP
jgi:hypothetical protein